MPEPDGGYFTEHGFTWGPAEVTAMASVPGRGRVISVRTEHVDLQVYVSEKGHKIRVWRGREELT